MQTYASKKQENKSQSVANAFFQKKHKDRSSFPFEDKRPEAIQKRKLQKMTVNYSKNDVSHFLASNQDIRSDAIEDAVPIVIDISHNFFSQRSTQRKDKRNDHTKSPEIAYKLTQTRDAVKLAAGILGTTTPTHKTSFESAEKKNGALHVKLTHHLNIDVSKPDKPPIDVGTAEGLRGIKKANWQAARDDVTPNAMGKAPRLVYWSSKLVDDHEQHHVNDCKEATKSGIDKATLAISAKTITKTQYKKRSADELAMGLDKTAEKIIKNEDWKDYYGVDFPITIPHDNRPGEIRTYQKGKPDYEALVQKINTVAATAGWDGSGQKQPRSTITEKKNNTFWED